MKKIVYGLTILLILGSVFLTACGSTSGTMSNPTLTPNGSPDSPNTRSQIVVISDIHLGVSDSFAECVKNRSALVDFLNQTRNSPNIKELVIDGDFLDEWVLPMDYIMPPSESALVDTIAANNKTVIEAFNNIIGDGNIKVTYIHGNHDMLVTAADIQRIFPGINQSRDDAQGLSTYVTGVNSEIAIEHGHRYVFSCSPDPISNRNITQNGTSILPVGYFFTRIAASSLVEGNPATSNVLPEINANQNDPGQLGYYVYAKTLAAVLSKVPVKEAFSAKVLQTQIDGYTENYAINDLMPYQDPSTGKLAVNLYKGIVETWEKRQELNGVPVLVPLKDAILKSTDDLFEDSQAKTQYFDRDSSKRIVVFGHTHVAKLEPCTNVEGQKTIYANTGTWIDNTQDDPAMTYIIITLPEGNSAVESVSLYQYSADKTVTQLGDTQSITIR